MSDLFGWDLIYKLSENDLKKKEDVLTLFIHYILIRAGYKCIGLGDDKVLTGNEVSSETLPTDWNKEYSYSIRYCLNNGLYILKGIPVDTNIVYNLLSMEEKSGSEMKVTNVAFNAESVVSALKGDIATIIPGYGEVMKKVQSDLLNPLQNGNTKEATTQATPAGQAPPTRREPPRSQEVFTDPLMVGGPPQWGGAGFDPERDPLRVGRSDLDPFGQGGGMIFNPFGRTPRFHDPTGGLGGGPHLPRGAVPPGARFDPFGPVLPNPPRPRRPPGSDEFHPPGFDDMFM